MMISVDIRKKDLFILSLYLIPRLKGNWIFFGVLSLLIFVAVYFNKSPQTMSQVGVVAGASVGAALGGVISALVINIVTMLLKVGNDSAVLGRHTYGLSEQGLEERSHGAERLLPWRAIASIARLPGYMLFRVSSNQFHLVPRRAFDSAANFKAFCERASALKAAA